MFFQPPPEDPSILRAHAQARHEDLLREARSHRGIPDTRPLWLKVVDRLAVPIGVLTLLGLAVLALKLFA